MRKRVWKSNLRNLKEKPLRIGTQISEEGCCSAVSRALGVGRRYHRAGLRPLKKRHELAEAGVSGEVQWSWFEDCREIAN